MYKNLLSIILLLNITLCGLKEGNVDTKKTLVPEIKSYHSIQNSTPDMTKTMTKTLIPEITSYHSYLQPQEMGYIPEVYNTSHENSKLNMVLDYNTPKENSKMNMVLDYNTPKQNNVFENVIDKVDSLQDEFNAQVKAKKLLGSGESGLDLFIVYFGIVLALF